MGRTTDQGFQGASFDEVRFTDLDLTKIQRFIQTVDQVGTTVACCGEKVQLVDSFPYLGSRVSSDGKSEKDITRSLGFARGKMSSLGVRVWRSRHLSRRTKVVRSSSGRCSRSCSMTARPGH